MYGNNEAIKVVNKNDQEELVTVSKYIINEIDSDELEFKDMVLKAIYEEFKNKLTEDGNFEEKYLLTSTHQLSKIWKKHDNLVETEDMKLKEIVPETINAFKNQKVLALIKDTQKQLKTAQETNDSDNILVLQQRYIILNELKRNLSKNLGDRIIL